MKITMETLLITYQPWLILASDFNRVTVQTLLKYTCPVSEKEKFMEKEKEIILNPCEIALKIKCLFYLSTDISIVCLIYFIVAFI